MNTQQMWNVLQITVDTRMDLSPEIGIEQVKVGLDDHIVTH